mgnify:CR=1 FL=1
MNLCDFYNIHQNKTAFIVGAGPSLHFQDLNPIKDHVVFGVNSAIMKVPYADYFVSDDKAIKEWNYFYELPNLKCVKFLYKDKLHDIYKSPDAVWYEHHPDHAPDFSEDSDNGYEMSKDPKDPIIGARTSVASAVHLAYIMGCDPIVFLGCDCCHQRGKRYFWQFPNEPKVFRPFNPKPPWTRANRGGYKNRAVDQHCMDFLDYWRKFYNANKEKVQFVYCSEGGILDAFPNIMSLKEFLSSL